MLKILRNTQMDGKGSGPVRNNNLEQHVQSNNYKETIKPESGINGLTLRAGLLYPIMYKEILAGEYIKSWNVDTITRIITPLVPTLDKAFVTVQAYFVPHTRVWDKAEETLARKKAITSANENIPNYTLPKINTQKVPFKNTIIARYGLPNWSGDTKINLLPIRGYRAIWNDYIRIKDWQPKLVEWNETTPVSAEQTALQAYNTTSGAALTNAYVIEPAAPRKTYLTNVRRVLGSDGLILDDVINDTQAQHLDWQTDYQLRKQSAANQNKNDWDIVAEMGGTAPVKTDRVEFLGQIDYELNYQQITQTAPNIDDSSPLGTTGSFSYTRGQGELFSHKKFLQHGFIHILISIGVENEYEESTPKELLKNQISEIYTPALAKKEIQLLKSAEIANVDTTGIGSTTAYQPAWAELKRLPRFISGDMRTKLLLKTSANEPNQVTVSQWHNKLSAGSLSGAFDMLYGQKLAEKVFRTFERNNILAQGGAFEWLREEQIISMSEHNIETSLPVEKSVLTGNSKAEQAR